MFRTMFRTLALGLLASVLVVGAGAGTGSAAANDCTLSGKDGENDVSKACKAGGIKRAKAIMKAMTKAVKDKGMKIKGAVPDCDSCHKNEEDWALTDNSKADFKKMLELVKEAQKEDKPAEGAAEKAP